MFIKSIRFQYFRNLHIEQELAQGINFIVANNGSGKSNFLDGIYNLGFGKSFRSSLDGASIVWGSKLGFARIDATYESETEEESKQLAIIFSQVQDRNIKKYLVNGRSTSKPKFTQNLNVVLFAPQDLDIISGSPEVRRSDLDDFLSSFDFEYQFRFKEYKQILKNRNILLQNIFENKATTRQLKYWNQKLIELGSYLIHQRILLIDEFLPVFRAKAEALFNSEVKDLSISYLTKYFAKKESEVRNLFASKLAENESKEIRAGRSLYGPHREDFEVLFNDRPIRLFGSRGQQRIAALIYKLSQWEFITKRLNAKPILLLDDIMSELDKVHSKNLEEVLLGIESQVILTATSNDDFTEEFMAKGQQLSLS